MPELRCPTDMFKESDVCLLPVLHFTKYATQFKLQEVKCELTTILYILS